MARSDQIVRILTVARALSASRRGVSLKALAERLGVPWRSVYRDVAALERAGFPVEEGENGRRLRSDWTAPNLPGFEPDEILAFFAVRALTQSWRATALGRPLDRLWMKLTASRTGQGALVPVGREAWFAVRSPLAIDYRAYEGTIAAFEKATRERLVVACRYGALSTGELTTRQVEPGELYWDPGLESLYVIGWCRLRGDVRVFAMHRFASATLTEEHFAPRAETRSKAALKNAFRVWRGSSAEAVRIRFSRAVAQEIRERTWAPGQKITEEAGGGLVLKLEVAGIAEVQRWVMGFGGAAEVLAPEELRDGVARSFAEGAARYRNGGVVGETGERRPAGRADRLARDDNGRG